ncbi:MAG: hypothetical protein K2M10_05560, partial [Muribaculaceae bacterium]|nr:hypothetical protein [Muribaculaceae bacterium]
FYGEVVGGIKVNLWRGIGMGWNIRYRLKLNVSDGSNSTPWFIPGCGAGSAIGFSFSLIYTLPLNKDSEKIAESRRKKK